MLSAQRMTGQAAVPLERPVAAGRWRLGGGSSGNQSGRRCLWTIETDCTSTLKRLQPIRSALRVLRAAPLLRALRLDKER